MMTRALLGSCLLLAACGGDGGPVATPQPKPVASVTVSPASLSLLVGQSGTLAAEAKDASGAVLSGRTITWSSSDGAIATVSTAGMVTGVAVGTATVSAASEGKTGVATITVAPVPVALVLVTPASADLVPGETRQFTASPRDSAETGLAGRTVTWTSSNAGVVTVSATGLATAQAVGATVLITATCEGKSASASVTVRGAVMSRTAAGGAHTVAIKSDGTLWAWGSNGGGQLGDGTTIARLTPTPIGTGTTWRTVVAGAGHTLALKSDGTLWAWGSNGFGQLGDGTPTSRSTPTPIAPGQTWLAIATGREHTIAIRSDRTLWVWGSNLYGRLGDGTTIDKLAPTQIGLSGTWIAVAAGGWHSLALRSDGTLWVWGNNGNGQLGDGTINGRETPIQIETGSTWTSIAAGFAYTLAIKSDGTLWAWGHNGFGQLGDGTTDGPINQGRITPTPIGTNANWSAIAAGYNHTLAIKTDGTLWVWGSNVAGQLGNGTRGNLGPTPTQVEIGTTWTNVAGGTDHTIALKSDGTFWAWGFDSSGQLGDGGSGMTFRLSPTLIVF